MEGNSVRLIRSILISVLLLPPLAGAAEVVLTADTNIRMDRVGAAREELVLVRSLLEKYLLQVLRKETLEGPGEAVTIELEAKALIWHELTKEDLEDITDQVNVGVWVLTTL